MSKEFEELLEGIMDYCNGTEASVVKLKMQIQKVLGANKPSAQLPFDMTKIQWQQKTGDKGEFELSEDYDCPDHQALLKFLADAGGRVRTEGYFVWLFTDEKTIGRKLLKRNLEE